MGFEALEQSLWKELFGEEEGDSKDSGQNLFDEHFDDDGGSEVQQKRKNKDQLEEENVVKTPKSLSKRIYNRGRKGPDNVEIFVGREPYLETWYLSKKIVLGHQIGWSPTINKNRFFIDLEPDVFAHVVDWMLDGGEEDPIQLHGDTCRGCPHQLEFCILHEYARETGKDTLATWAVKQLHSSMGDIGYEHIMEDLIEWMWNSTRRTRSEAKKFVPANLTRLRSMTFTTKWTVHSRTILNAPIVSKIYNTVQTRESCSPNYRRGPVGHRIRREVMKLALRIFFANVKAQDRLEKLWRQNEGFWAEFEYVKDLETWPKGWKSTGVERYDRVVAE